MIDLYYWTTPNGHKITMFLEEAGLPYKVFPISIGKGDQFKPDFLAIAPNNRIPALVDHEPKGGGKPISMFESGAMLLYLAEKTGKFLPSDLYGRYDTIQWVFWQMGGLGPMAGQNHHFNNYAQEKIKYAIDRYVNETNRLYGVLNKRLADREFIAGEYSIADMASYPWVVPYKNQGQDIEQFPHVKIVREYFRPGLPRLSPQSFDAIFSISVLEHIAPDSLPACFDAIVEFLSPAGVSVHCFDFILQGPGDAHDLMHAQRILAEQKRVTSTRDDSSFEELVQRLRGDVETFFLSPQGHHHWRGGQPYSAFPFRKVVSIQTVARRELTG